MADPVVISERTEVASVGVRTAATVELDSSGFEVISGSTAQAGFASADAALEGTVGGIAGALAAAVSAEAAAVAAQGAAEAALAAAEDAAEAAGEAGGEAGGAAAGVAALNLRTRLVAGGAGSTASNTAAQTTVATGSTPLSVEPGDRVVLRARGTLLNNSGAPVAFTPRVKLGATTLVAGAGVAQAANAAAAPWELEATIFVASLVSQTAMVSSVQGAPVASGVLAALDAAGPMAGLGRGAAAENLSTAKAVVLSIQMGAAAATVVFTVSSFELLVVKGP